jgi:hypothetical protein
MSRTSGPRKVEVTWQDACFNPTKVIDAVDLDSMKAGTYPFGVENITLGWLVHKDDNFVVVAMEVDNQGVTPSYRHTCEIPTSWVKKIRTLR